jgi:modulator of FtsH protease HflK
MPWQSGGSGNGGGSGGGGGPWGGGGGGNDGGGGNKNPWGQRPGGGNGGGGGRGPDLDKLLRRGQERLKSGLPGGPGGNRLLGYGALGLLGLWIISSSVYRVNEGEVAAVMQFGRFDHMVTGTGLKFKLPSPIQTIIKQGVGQSTMEVSSGGGGGEGQNLVLTQDQNLIAVDATIQWQVRAKQADKYIFALEEPEQVIRNAAEAALRGVLSRVTFDAAITRLRSQIEIDVQRETQRILNDYGAGVEISGVFIKTQPPKQVEAAFNEVSKASQDVGKFLSEAKAYSSSVIARAKGDTARFDAVYAQFKLSPEVTRKRLYLETMEDVLTGTTKVIIDSKGTVPYLPLPAVMPRAQTDSIQVQASGNSSK